MPETMPTVPIAVPVIGPTLPAVDAVRAQILRELQLVALDNARALQAFDSGARDICSGLRLLANADTWTSPAQRCLALEAELLADAISLVATAAALAEEDYRSVHDALALESAALIAR
ncbi:hypothetical protein [Pseudoclavibacter sp. RFBA6]|uniref:hypothetical protein n=1 Tax=Pseudoclavibacter sp. RFBA6 TaxID=2080573 RepID=UPI000CE7CD99|nr:hypothetical protein [Pseudoclavibacter sp. RFBA6]PPG38105.1 hypothetical protein C5C17_15775 [Pseudoclavibacter sp. RFBA6]